MNTLIVQKIKKFPEELKAALRGLSFGPYTGTMWRWTFHDGSTYAAVLTENSVPIAWSCLTFQEEIWPVVGVYVNTEYRGKGYAEYLVRAILEKYRDKINKRGSMVYAVSAYYSKYAKIIYSMGFTHREWE